MASFKKYRKILLIASVASLVAVLVYAILYTLFVSSVSTASLRDMARMTNFAVYELQGDVAKDYDLRKESIRYEQRVLIYELHHKSGKKLAVTEQKQNGFDSTTLKADIEFKTPYGQGYVTDGVSRTTGTLISDDGTWILINAPSPIGGDAMKNLINNLRPIDLSY